MMSFLFLYTVAPYDINITGDDTYSNGSLLQLHCISDGGPNLEYSWSRTNPLSTTNTNNLTISNVTTIDGGNYTCTVTNDAGSSNNTITVYSELRSSYNIFLCSYAVYYFVFVEYHLI